MKDFLEEIGINIAFVMAGLAGSLEYGIVPEIDEQGNLIM